jgi:hypothetical protein
MEIRYHKMPIFLVLFLALCTFGIVNLIIYLKMKRWPQQALDEGLKLRNGTLIRWQDITRVVHVVTSVEGTTAARYDFETQHGTIAFPFQRVVNSAEVIAYIWQRLPAPAKGEQRESAVEPAAAPVSSPSQAPPSPGSPGTQTFYCRDCAYRWGPVGVQPFNPDAVEHQLFLYCEVCREPQAVVTAQRTEELACLHCEQVAIKPLSDCPLCESVDVGWA